MSADHEAPLRIDAAHWVSLGAFVRAAETSRQYGNLLIRLNKIRGRMVGREWFVELKSAKSYVALRGRQIPAAWER
jgi:hypothetical protein